MSRWTYFSLGICFLFVLVFHPYYIDDTYITLKYVDTLVNHLTWGMYEGIPANSATSPLNVLWLSLITFFTQDAEISVVISNLILIFLIHFELERIRKNLGFHVLFPTFAASFIVLNPFLFSALGLESLLTMSLFLAWIQFFLEKKFLRVGIFLGLMFLSRMDSILLVFPFLFFLRNKIFTVIKILFISFLVVLPWFIFSYMYFGSLIPDTLLIKKFQSWGSFSFGNGLILYFNKYPYEVFVFILSLLVLIILKFFAVSYRNIIKNYGFFLILSAILHYIAYTLLNVPPYHWYYVPSTTALLLGLSFCTFSFSKTQILKQLSFVYVLFLIYTGLVYFNSWKIKEMPIHTNWTSRDNYKQIAQKIDSLNLESTFYHAHIEIGSLAYFSTRSILIDPFSSRKMIERECTIYGKHKWSIFLYLSCLNLKTIQENNQKLKKIPSTNLAFFSEQLKKEDSVKLILGTYSSKWTPLFYVIVR